MGRKNNITETDISNIADVLETLVLDAQHLAELLRKVEPKPELISKLHELAHDCVVAARDLSDVAVMAQNVMSRADRAAAAEKLVAELKRKNGDAL